MWEKIIEYQLVTRMIECSRPRPEFTLTRVMHFIVDQYRNTRFFLLSTYVVVPMFLLLFRYSSTWYFEYDTTRHIDLLRNEIKKKKRTNDIMIIIFKCSCSLLNTNNSSKLMTTCRVRGQKNYLAFSLHYNYAIKRPREKKHFEHILAWLTNAFLFLSLSPSLPNSLLL